MQLKREESVLVKTSLQRQVSPTGDQTNKKQIKGGFLGCSIRVVLTRLNVSHMFEFLS